MQVLFLRKSCLLVILHFLSASISAQEFLASSGVDFGINVFAKMRNTESSQGINGYDIIDYNITNVKDIGGNLKFGYALNKKKNWYLSLSSGYYQLSYALRFYNLGYAFREHPPVKINFQRIESGLGIHRFFGLYDNRLYIDVGLSLNARFFFQDNIELGDLDPESNSLLPSPFSPLDLHLEYKIKAENKGDKITPVLFSYLSYFLNEETSFYFGFQLGTAFSFKTSWDFRWHFYHQPPPFVITGYGIFNFNRTWIYNSFAYFSFGIRQKISL